MSTAKFDTWMNPDGTTNYKCRSWVNFDGTTSPGTIRASGNVSSVTRNGTGDYTVNFTTAMPDANYVALADGDFNGTDQNMSRGAHIDNLASGSYRVCTGQFSTGVKENFSLVLTSVFR